MNNFKQMSLAILEYSGANQDQLPGEWATFLDRNSEPLKCFHLDFYSSFSWRATILPFIEERGLFDQIRFDKSARAEAHLPVHRSQVSVYQCPSTPGSPRATPESGFATTDYSVSRSPVLYRADHFAHAAFDGVNSFTNDGDHKDSNRERAFLRILADGICPLHQHRRSAKLRWITDGMSKTTMLIEQAMQPNVIDPRMRDSEWKSGGSWAHASHTDSHGARKINTSNYKGRLSFHPHGVNNAMMDGSVRFLGVSTHRAVLRAMDTRSMGDSFSDSSGPTSSFH